MYKGFIRFIIDMKSDSSTTLITYNFSISDKSFEFVKKSICACVKLLVLIGAKDIDCDFFIRSEKGVNNEYRATNYFFNIMYYCYI